MIFYKNGFNCFFPKIYGLKVIEKNVFSNFRVTEENEKKKMFQSVWKWYSVRLWLKTGGRVGNKEKFKANLNYASLTENVRTMILRRVNSPGKDEEDRGLRFRYKVTSEVLRHRCVSVTTP